MTDTVTPVDPTALIQQKAGELHARRQALETERNAVALAAFEGDPAARERHAAIEQTLTTLASELTLCQQALDAARAAHDLRVPAEVEACESELVEGLAATERAFEALLATATATPTTIPLSELQRLYSLGKDAYARAMALHRYFRERGDKAKARQFVRTWNLETRFGPALVARVPYFSPGGGLALEEQPWRQTLARLRQLRPCA